MNKALPKCEGRTKDECLYACIPKCKWVNNQQECHDFTEDPTEVFEVCFFGSSPEEGCPPALNGAQCELHSLGDLDYCLCKNHYCECELPTCNVTEDCNEDCTCIDNRCVLINTCVENTNEEDCINDTVGQNPCCWTHGVPGICNLCEPDMMYKACQS